MELKQLADYIANLNIDVLPRDVRDAARMHLLDTIAAMIAGRGSEVDRALVQIRGNDPEWDALVGAALAHRHEVDDIFDEAILCIGGLVIPVALAVGKKSGASGSQVLAALVAGYEVMGRVGLAIGSADFLRRGWWPTAVCGAFGAAAVAGRLLDLDDVAMGNALGLAGMNSGGLTGGEDGIMGRNLLYGNVARSGWAAALAAHAGLTGPLSLFVGQRSFSNAYGVQSDLRRLVDALGDEFIISGTTIKPYACARQLHGAVEMVLDLRRGGLDPTRVEQVVLELPPESAFLNRPPDSELPTAPAGSAHWVIAVAFVRGSVMPADFSPEALGPQDVRDLAERVQVRITPPGVRPPLSASLQVRVQGNVLQRDINVPKGGPLRPLTEKEATAKALALMQPKVGHKAERIVELVSAIEELTSVDELASLCYGLNSPNCLTA